MNDQQAVVDAILRSDFPSFVAKAFAEVSGGDVFQPNWHLEAIGW